MTDEPTREETPGIGPSSTELSIAATLADDKRTASLQFMIGGNVTWQAVVDAATLDAIIRKLDVSRGQMLEPISPDVEIGKLYPSNFNPRWRVEPDSENRFAVIWIRNPGVGWYAYGFPRDEVAAIVKWLRKIPAITTADEKHASLPAHATSFGGDRLLITTTGLGFYYYGEGEKRIGPNPFEQIEFDSDRAAGIVAGSLAERRLEQALQSLMKDDEPVIVQQLFEAKRPSWPPSVPKST